MTRNIAIVCLLTFAAGVLVGCHQGGDASMSAHAGDVGENQARKSVPSEAGEKGAVSAEVEADRIVAARANKVQIPSQWRFANVSSVRGAPSWDARLSRLPAAEEAWLQERNDHYADALAFGSLEEQQRMIAQGFPMPEEWLAAKRMPDLELEGLAKAGNRKARMFYIDRVSDRIGSIRGSGQGLKTSSPQDMALLSRAAAADTMALQLMKSTGSPFAAYLDARINAAMTQYTPPESMASAILLAGDLGDARARELRARYFRDHPDMDAALITQKYMGRKHLVLGQN